MPGLVREDYTQLDYVNRQDDPLFTGPPSPTALSPLSPSAQGRKHVRFIPSQMDPLSATDTEAARESPLKLFVKDAGVLFTLLQWLPHSGLQKNIDCLSEIFGRPIIGIHNKTYGMIADVLECLVQRDFSYNTMDVRVTYDYLKACLCDPTIHKIILIAHSQGGIIVCMALDHLFADLPRDVFSKLELYTFGSAASHCNNPLSVPKPPKDASEANKGRCIRYIEHYCNEYDMIARWGPLYNITTVLDNRYCGRVFVRMGATGHLFNQHYLDAMFPQASANQEDHTNGHSNGISKLDHMANDFLNTVVDVHESLAWNRESTALSKMGVMRRESEEGPFFEFGDGKVVPVDALVDGKAKGRKKGEMSIELLNGGTGEDSNITDARGKPVRELSRLWMYLGGGSPKD
ncbi:MAG: hypothetical protein Q9191_005530 [Dirinaria sp. TL-2023a]